VTERDEFRDLLIRVRAFEAAAHELLGVHETAPSRVYTLDKAYRELTGLSLKQDDLLRQAIRCVETQLYRAAHVLAWAGLMDFLEEKLAADGLVKLRARRPAWVHAMSLEGLRENTTEFQIVDVARELGLLSKAEHKALHGMLSKRNECAHPSDYYPGMDESLGYITEIFKRLKAIQPKSL